MSTPLPDDENLDVIQNIELTINYVHLRTPTLTDYEVMSAVEALQKNYQSEALEKTPNLLHNPNSLTVYTAVHAICELRLGRNASFPPGIEGPWDVEIVPITVDDLLKFLKRIHKSIENLNKIGGTRGYLNNISQLMQ